ncbi:unnamed protein product [Orchesella dallaii]|uniref:Uncharacterized protein n=1 Tax=Orchesella dallaii TaxID=48710 RepID=A0ABP1QXF0_9HEXA
MVALEIYLHRPVACSSESERVIGSSTFGCETNISKTQALILVSSENLPSTHSIAFYDDEEELTNFRKHVVGDQTVHDEPAADYAIVTNPNNISINIGRICYNAHHFDGAIKIFIQDIRSADPGGVFTRPCNEESIQVYTTNGETFPEIPETEIGGYEDTTTISPDYLGNKLNELDVENSLVEKREIKEVKKSDILIDLSKDGGVDSTEDMPNKDSSMSSEIDLTSSDGPVQITEILTSPNQTLPNQFDNVDDQLDNQQDTLIELGDDEQTTVEGNDLQFMDMKPDDGDYKYSGEMDQLGSWESLNAVLSAQEFEDIGVPGTLEHDASIGGIITVFSNSGRTSAEFESLISVMKSQVSGLLNESNDFKHVLDIGQPSETQWYMLLSMFIEVAKGIVPDIIVQDDFFQHALLVFGNYAKHITDINPIRYDKFKSILDNMEMCAARAKTQSSLFYVKPTTLDCDLTEIETSTFNMHEYNSHDKSSSSVMETIHYESSDPNTYLPPLRSRIKRTVWIFTEIIWYSLQLSYSFCFNEFAQSDPNSFFNMIFYVIEYIFKDNSILNIWNSRKTGNLEVFESLLPFIQHSGRVSGSSNGQDFSTILNELDKISFVIHQTSILNHWLVRPSPSTYPLYQQHNHTNIVQAKAHNLLMRGRRDVNDENNAFTYKPTLFNGLAHCLAYNQHTLIPSITQLRSSGIC